MVFETASSDELAYAVDYQDNDLDKLWNRDSLWNTQGAAEVRAASLMVATTINNVAVVAVPKNKLARV